MTKKRLANGALKESLFADLRRLHFLDPPQ
jgi:hypothetical protein